MAMARVRASNRFQFTCITVTTTRPEEWKLYCMHTYEHLDGHIMLRQIVRPSTLRQLTPRNLCSIPRRTLIAAPKPGDGPLMERRADRELPVPEGNRLLRTLPIFLVILGATTLAFFNYQKSSSSVVTSSLYALRVNPEARRALGDEIYFASKVPYIWGSIDQLHGKVDVSFKVKGTKGEGMMKFKCERRARMGYVSVGDMLHCARDAVVHRDPHKVSAADPYFAV